MQLLDLTLETPAENLALDEALLEDAEQSGQPGEVLRLWEPRQPMVVVGRSSRVDAEVRRDECEWRGVPILRRSSGGAAVVTGPGCLMYGVVLSYQHRPELRMIEQAHRFVLGKMRSAIESILPGELKHQGSSDLTLAGRKFSGNSLRCKRTHLLYHGTLLFDFSLELIEACLKMPPRRPDYRCDRPHSSFVANLPVEADTLRAAIVEEWQAIDALVDWPQQRVRELVREKYACDDWNSRF